MSTTFRAQKSSRLSASTLCARGLLAWSVVGLPSCANSTDAPVPSDVGASGMAMAGPAAGASGIAMGPGAVGGAGIIPSSGGASGSAAGGVVGLPSAGGGGAGSGSGGTSTAQAGGAGMSSGGVAGAGNTGGAGAGCVGTPIVPDSGGFVAAGTNPLGIHGSWFVYSDCIDQKGKNCSTVTTPVGSTFANVGGKMCTSGSTAAATGAWGAGIGLELNDLPPQQPYDTTLHGIKGFCFVLSGPTIPASTIRVAFPTKSNPDNAYFEAVSTPGAHSVLFSDTAQGTWVTTKTAFEPTKVMLLQFQIPSLPTAPVPWDFCIEGLTAITN